jgi:uncharacterized protein YecE (DUF72 family)
MVRIGTSGYSYTDWIGPYYPPGTPQRDFLKIYSSEFNLVELNFSYYTQPKAATLERMLQITADDFLFTIKAHRSMTHEITDNLAGMAETFRQGLQPLRISNRLAAVLLQFPYSFHYTPESRRHLDRISKLLEGLPLAFEFRGAEWQRESVYTTMREREIALVCVDEPDLPRLPKPDETVTSGLAYLRFHGRNSANWWHGDNKQRYDYLYSDHELSDWVGRVKRIARKARLLLVAFNNHFRSQAIKNARRFKFMLTEAGLKEVH